MAIAAFLFCSVVLHVAWGHSNICPAPPVSNLKGFPNICCLEGVCVWGGGGGGGDVRKYTRNILNRESTRDSSIYIPNFCHRNNLVLHFAIVYTH